MGCYYHYGPCQEARFSLTDADIQRGMKKRQQNEMRSNYIQQKGYQIVEMWECEWWNLYKTDASNKSHLRKNFSYRRPSSEEQLLHGIIDGRLFGYVQCDIEVSSPTSAKLFLYLSSDIQNYRSQQGRYWYFDERICRKGKFYGTA